MCVCVRVCVAVVNAPPLMLDAATVDAAAVDAAAAALSFFRYLRDFSPFFGTGGRLVGAISEVCVGGGGYACVFVGKDTPPPLSLSFYFVYARKWG